MAIDGDLSMLADFGVKTVDTGAKSPGPGSPSGLSDFASSPDRDASLSPAAGAAAASGNFAARANVRLTADAPSASDQKFLSRSDKRKVEQAFPAGGGVASKHAKAGAALPGFEAVGDATDKTDRHMFDTMQAQSKALRARTEELGQAILSGHGMSEAPSDDPLALTQETVTVVGRVCCERGAHKLTAHNIGIECVWSTETGDHSERARLDVHQLGRYSLFPGQVIAVEGVITQASRLRPFALNHRTYLHVICSQSRGGEKTVKASRVVEGMPLPAADRRTASGPGVHALVAAGPCVLARRCTHVWCNL